MRHREHALLRRGVTRLRSRNRWAIGAALAASGLVVGAAGSQAWEPEVPPVPRSPVQTMRGLLGDIHSEDSQVSDAAFEELDTLGVSGKDLQYAIYLKHPDRVQRLQLARRLPEIHEPLRTDLRAELVRDADPDVRTTAEAQPAGSRVGLIESEYDFDQIALADASADGSASAVLTSSEQVPGALLQITPGTPSVRPNFLERPEDESFTQAVPAFVDHWVTPEDEAPFGFSGPSGIMPFEAQETADFVPHPDRWRNGYTPSDRYGKGHPWVDDYHGVEGHWWDPYNQNVLKGDFPIIGQHTFFSFTGTSATSLNFRQVPTGTSAFESTDNPGQEEFFGDPNQVFINQNFFAKFALFHANDAAFKPLDWQVVLTPAVNINSLHVNELAVVSPNVQEGLTRDRTDIALQEYFVEAKLADLSPNYDFLSVRAGSQSFNSDFRSFIFNDTNRAIRLFGTNFANRHQFNLLYYDMTEKETNSQLNTFFDRHQNVLIANYYIQDFIFPGYTAQTSFHMNHDDPSREFDRNRFLARPDATGVAEPHRVEAYYLGIAGDGHIGRVNVSNAFYWVTGRDSLNPIGGQELDINSYMAAIELSYDRDWARFRGSFFYAQGDGDPYDQQGSGFDTIMDNPNFAGGNFSYWQRNAIGLFNTQLVNQNSLVPNLRSSKIQGQANFTNPGLLLFNLGFDADITPKLRMVTNANYLMFDETEVLKQFVFSEQVDDKIGLDLSAGFEWRPFHNDNMVMLFGLSSLLPDRGFRDLYGSFGNSNRVDPLYSTFFEMNLVF